MIKKNEKEALGWTKRLISVLLAMLFVAAMLVSCKTADGNEQPMENSASASPALTPTIASGGIENKDRLTLDFDGTDGYTGDYILIMNLNYPDGQRLSTGYFDENIYRENWLFELSDKSSICDSVYESTVSGEPDPYAENLPQQDYYGLEDGDSWQQGFEKGFYFVNSEGVSPGDEYIAFKVLYVGRHCRIWTPLNPEYMPLDLIDASYAWQIADEFDAKYPFMISTFGEFADLRGDGKVNLMFYNIHTPNIGGYTNQYDLYPAVNFRDQELASNALPMIHIDTYGPSGILELGEDSAPHANVEKCFSVIIHEFQHLLYESQEYMEAWHEAYYVHAKGSRDYAVNYRDYLWMTEFMSAAAGILCYPEMMLETYVPYWYNEGATYNDVMNNALVYDAVAANPDYPAHQGKSIFDWTYKKDSYALAAFLSAFVYEQADAGVFLRIQEIWRSRNELDNIAVPTDAVMHALEYESMSQFIQDFILSFILQEDLLHKYMLPIISNSPVLYLQPAGFTLVKTLNGNYMPPVTAQDGLVYVGIGVNK